MGLFYISKYVMYKPPTISSLLEWNAKTTTNAFISNNQLQKNNQRQ